MKKKKYTLEYVIKSSPVILYEFISTPSGLSQWFADHVDNFRDLFTFDWEGSKQNARMLENIEYELVKFRWEDAPKEEYFEFKITHTEVTNETVLIITDFAAPNEMKDNTLLWDSQVKLLTQNIGGLG